MRLPTQLSNLTPSDGLAKWRADLYVVSGGVTILRRLVMAAGNVVCGGDAFVTLWKID